MTPNQFQVLLVLVLLGEQNQQMRLFPTSSSRKYIILHQIRHQSGFILQVQVIEESREDFPVNGMLSINKIGVSPPERMSTASVIDNLFSGEDLSAIMVLPMRKDAMVTSPKQGWTPAAITENEWRFMLENTTTHRHAFAIGKEEKSWFVDLTKLPEYSLSFLFGEVCITMWMFQRVMV